MPSIDIFSTKLALNKALARAGLPKLPVALALHRRWLEANDLSFRPNRFERHELFAMFRMIYSDARVHYLVPG